MDDQKEIKKTPVKSEKDEKVSPEEIKKRKEAVLARIDAEIGEEDAQEEVVIDEKTDEKIEVEEDTKAEENFEKEMLSENVEENKDEEVDDEEREEVEEEKKRVVESKNKEEKETEGLRDEGRSTFSAAEFGLVERKNNKSKNLILFLVVFLLVAILSALFYLFATGVLKFEQKDSEQEVAPTEAPTPTPVAAEFDRAELSVQVLNGSGVSGAAGVMETFLADAGYENIEIGNADGSDFENITIQIKKEFEDFAELISEDLSDEYIVNEDYELLDEDSEYDLIIIVGSEVDEDTADVEAEADE